MRDTSSEESRTSPRPLTGVIAFAFSAGFFLIGLFTLDAYGASWDEPLHRTWGEATWAYLRSGDTRLITELPGAGQHYGPLFYLLNYGVSEAAHNLTGIDFTAANHVLTLFTAALGVALTFLLAHRLLGSRVAVAAATLLVLMPHFLAHAHYNPKDIPLLTMTAATLLAGTIAHQTQRVSYAVLTGLLMGASIAMKPTAVVLVPVLGAAVLADILPHWRQSLRRVLGLSIVSALAAAAGLFLTWPVLWRQPTHLLQSLGYFARGGFWTGNVLYFGELTPASALPWHYMPVMLFFSIPVVTTALAAAGVVRCVRRARHADARFAPTLLLLWVALPMVLFMKPGLARYDGMRQLFFAVPAVVILAGLGYDAVQAGTRRRRQIWPILASGIAAAWLCSEVVRWFPYGGSYVNAPARYLLGSHLERRFEMEYWGVAYRDGLRWLQENAPPHSTICVPVAGHLLSWQPELTRADLTFDCTPQASHLMLITRFSEWPDRYLTVTDQSPVYTVSRLGSDLLRIYLLP